MHEPNYQCQTILIQLHMHLTRETSTLQQPLEFPEVIVR